MTSDAKIGLLLGLIFIFIIAFIINGLPTLGKQADSNQLTARMIESYDSPPTLGSKEQSARRLIIENTQSSDSFRPENNRRSYSTEDFNITNHTGPEEQPRHKIDLPQNPELKDAGRKAVAAVKESRSSGSAKRTIPQPQTRTYTVKKGDNLAKIAKKVYGGEAGNKRANIKRIFEANKEHLKSPDKIYVGQELIIPDLNSAGSGLQKVESTTSTPAGSTIPRTYTHIVKKGQSLWDIAQKRLGNGKRYREILELNSDVLKDKDHVIVGMELKIPAD